MASGWDRASCSGSPRQVATVCGSRSGSCSPPSSTRHTPSANRPPARAAARSATRVLPTPPGPVTVTSRAVLSNPSSTASSRWRPTNPVTSAGNSPGCRWIKRSVIVSSLDVRHGQTYHGRGDRQSGTPHVYLQIVSSCTLWVIEIVKASNRREPSLTGRDGHAGPHGGIYVEGNIRHCQRRGRHRGGADSDRRIGGGDREPAGLKRS